jgi:sec-independent protein translocase protein TatB
MFDVGWSELIVIAVVALVAIGPKELPGVLRMVGQWMAKIRRMAADFQGQFNEAMREAEMADIKKQFDEIKDTAKSFTGANLLSDVQKDFDDALKLEDKPAGDKSSEDKSSEDKPAEPVSSESPPVEPAKSDAVESAATGATPDLTKSDVPEPVVPESVVPEPVASTADVPAPTADGDASVVSEPVPEPAKPAEVRSVGDAAGSAKPGAAAPQAETGTVKAS